MPRLRARNTLTKPSDSPPPSLSTRPRRAASSAHHAKEDTITVARDSSATPDRSKKSIRLTVKMPSSKLREATARRGKTLQERESFEPGEVVRGARSTRAKKQVVISESSDEEEGVEEEVEEDDEVDAEGEEEEDAEGEIDEDAEGESDVDMADAPAPKVTVTAAKGTSAGRRAPPAKPVPKAPVVKPSPPKGRVKTVEEKEIQMADSGLSDDEELSELSDEDGEGEEEEEDAEGEEVDEDEEMGEEGDEDDAEGETDDDGTPEGTPDPSKMTKRQRTRLDQDFLQLPMEPQIKKHLTAEEHAMRRAEMARRRKNLSEKRNEEEKMETINRLLKKQAPKRRGKISAAEIAAGGETPEVEREPEAEKVDPVFSRWVNGRNGSVLGLPSEWKGTPMGRLAGGTGWRMVEEVE